MEELKDCKLELDNIIAYKPKVNIVQSRAREYKEDEKSTKYFLLLENHKQGLIEAIYKCRLIIINKTIISLEDNEGKAGG